MHVVEVLEAERDQLGSQVRSGKKDTGQRGEGQGRGEDKNWIFHP